MPIKKEYGIVNFGRESKMRLLSVDCTAVFRRSKDSGSLSIPVLTNDLSQIKELIEERKDGSLLLNFNYTIMLWHLMDENEFDETLGKIKKETEWFKKRAVQMLDPFVARVRFIDNAYRYFEGRGMPQFKYVITKEQYKILKEATEELEKQCFKSQCRFIRRKLKSNGKITYPYVAKYVWEGKYVYSFVFEPDSIPLIVDNKREAAKIRREIKDGTYNLDRFTHPPKC